MLFKGAGAPRAWPSMSFDKSLYHSEWGMLYFIMHNQWIASTLPVGFHIWLTLAETLCLAIRFFNLLKMGGQVFKSRNGGKHPIPVSYVNSTQIAHKCTLSVMLLLLHGPSLLQICEAAQLPLHKKTGQFSLATSLSSLKAYSISLLPLDSGMGTYCCKNSPQTNRQISWLCNVSGPMVRHNCHGLSISTHPSPVDSSF